MEKNLTLKSIRKTSFTQLYFPFISRKKLTNSQYECLLSVAILCLNADNTDIKKLGYRIIVEFCNQTGYYAPLYEIAINQGLYPISKFIESNTPAEYKNFFTEWNDAYTEQFHKGNLYQSEMQKELDEFFKSQINTNVAIIAPTSYGKSELILTAIKEFAGKNICVVTPTKALLMQTQKRIRPLCKRLNYPKIILHPEMYTPNDIHCIAVLTQERLLRLFKSAPNLSFDCIIIDEAHEILGDTYRSHILSTVIMTAKKRNPSITFKFLTPFLITAQSLRHRYISYNLEEFKIHEYIKTEKYFFINLHESSPLFLYDQFFDHFDPINTPSENNCEENIIKQYSAKKNLIYLNKPTDIETFALSLAKSLPDLQSDRIEKACKNIEQYLHPAYHLITCLKKGIIYHHGFIPDTIRSYIEDLYRTIPEIKYLISNSTLLSGVNLPAQKIFLLSNQHGRKNLSLASFKNLIGRICRFSEIFHPQTGSLLYLEPEIYIIQGRFASSRANYKAFLQKVARITAKENDAVDNILLTNSKIDKHEKELTELTEFIENYEKGIIPNYQGKYAQTQIGCSCITNGINEINIFAHEQEMKKILLECHIIFPINNTNTLMQCIGTIFLPFIEEKHQANILRLKNEEAQKFYASLLKWKIENKSYAEMIQYIVHYWKSHKQKSPLVYVGRWGDTSSPNNPNSIRHNYTDISQKNSTELINLAIVHLKEEQDFLENILIRYIEVFHDLNLLDPQFYSQVKYGTNNEDAICLLKNGFSLKLSLLLIEKYSEFIEIDPNDSIIHLNPSVVERMQKNEENQILISEIRSLL